MDVEPGRDDEKDGAATRLGGHLSVRENASSPLSFVVPIQRGGKVAVLVISLVWLIVISIVDIANGAGLAFAALLAAAPVVAALALGMRATASVAAIAIVLSVALGLVEANFTTAQHGLDVGVVVIVSLLAVWVSLLRTRLGQALEFTRQQATHDELTGLLNRRAILEVGERFAVLRSDVRPFLSLMLMDVDHFKTVNDTHGHLVGDDVLAAVAERLQDALRSGDLVGRYGGEEFLAVLVGGDHTAANTVASRTLDLVRKSPVVTSDGPVGITLSIGMSALASDERDLSGALQRADDALYESKRDGRARSTWRHSTEPFDVPHCR